MAHDDFGSDLNRLWQDQPAEEVSMTLDDIRARARKMERTVNRRNLREYAAALFVVVALGVITWREANVVVIAGSVLVVLGTLYVVYHIHKWGTARSMPADLAVTDCLEFHRAELVRQRDLLRSVWTWYLLPLVPGVGVMIVGRAIERPDRRLLSLGAAVFVAGTFFGIGKLNEHVARKLQRKIDGLDQAR